MMENTVAFKSYMSSPHPSIKHSTYFQVYEQLFQPYRNKKITFVEIGILDGGSLFMWREFFGKEARIIGIDLNPEAKKWEQDNFEIHIGSQSDTQFWKQFVQDIGPVDLVLDDGGHRFDQQIITIESMLDHINDGGMLVVEDTHTSYLEGFGDNHKSLMKYVKNYIDKINYRYSRLTRYATEHHVADKVDHKVFSIEIFESILAFKINRRLSHFPSYPTSNKDTLVQAEDYVHKEEYKDIDKFF